MPTRPNLVLITTGGTIAGRATAPDQTTGYEAGALDAADLLGAIPGHDALARIDVSPLLAIDSKDMTPVHWLQMARAVAAHLARPDCDGVVLTHGTDTLEETAWFLHLVLPPGKPVVITGAMRPASALSADGPMNLYQALRVAVSPESHGKGVLVVMNDQIFAGAEVTKTDTHALDAITAPVTGALGAAAPVRYWRKPDLTSAGMVPIHTLAALTELPRVDILYVAAGSDPDLLMGAGERQAGGVVLALPGDGSLPAAWHGAAREATASGVRVVRASRTGRGFVSSETGSDETPALLASGKLSPTKARIGLMLELCTGASALLAHLAG